MINNPFPITEKGLVSGQTLYNTFCAICHGGAGDGNGWLVDEAIQMLFTQQLQLI